MNIAFKVGSSKLNSYTTFVKAANRVVIAGVVSTLVACSSDSTQTQEAIIFGDEENNLLLELPAELKLEQASPDVSTNKIPSFL